MWKDLTTYCLRHLRSDLIKVSEIWSPTLVLSLQDSSVGGTPEVMGYRNAPCGVPGEPIQNKKQKNKRQQQSNRFRELNSDYIIYNDGSGSNGRLDGGAAAVITIGDTEEPIIVDTIKGRSFTCSYEEEACAMILATK